MIILVIPETQATITTTHAIRVIQLIAIVTRVESVLLRRPGLIYLRMLILTKNSRLQLHSNLFVSFIRE